MCAYLTDTGTCPHVSLRIGARQIKIGPMDDANTIFNHVSSLRAEALGEPGRRTFRILVDSGNSSALLWLEKDQLFQLAMAVKQVLISMSGEPLGVDAEPGEPEASRSTYLEFMVSKLSLGFDGNNGRLVIDAHDAQSGDDDPATLRVWGNQDQFNEFADQAIRVCAAGRPLCPLCAQPINPDGHKCARSNGHGLHDLRNL